MMKKFILFYKGPATPPDASHEKWPDWFQKVGEQLVDQGSPMQKRLLLHSDGSTSASVTDFNGYSIIQSENIEEALNLVRDHPYLRTGSDEFTVEIFELPT